MARAPFEIGGQTIAAGERATVDLPVMNLSTHAPMTMPIHVIHGRRAGPVLFVSGAVHGDEINGVEIIHRLLQLSVINRLRGTLLAVPIVNVFGFVANSRYLPDRRDLNRSFPGSPQGSLAGRLAHLFLTEVVTRANYGIDLHTGATGRTNYPQIRADLEDQETLDLASAFGVPLIINAGVRDGSIRKAAGERDVRVLVYEAGEALRFDEACIRSGVNGVVRVMRHLEMLSSKRREGKPIEPVIIRSSRWERAPSSGILRASTEMGVRVAAGELLGVGSDPFGETEHKIHSREDGVVVGRTTLPVVHEGDALFHIGRFDGTKVDADTLDAFQPGDDYEKGSTAELANEPLIV